LSASLNKETGWNFRKTDQRLIVIKTKNPNVRKAAALDVLSNLTFSLEIPDDLAADTLELEKEYLAELNIYTSENLSGVDKDFFNFFDAVDVDQPTDDFIKAYWVYPSKIRFELVEIEEP
jgi:hypothetical protein